MINFSKLLLQLCYKNLSATQQEALPLWVQIQPFLLFPCLFTTILFAVVHGLYRLAVPANYAQTRPKHPKKTTDYKTDHESEHFFS